MCYGKASPERGGSGGFKKEYQLIKSESVPVTRLEKVYYCDMCEQKLNGSTHEKLTISSITNDSEEKLVGQSSANMLHFCKNCVVKVERHLKEFIGKQPMIW